MFASKAPRDLATHDGDVCLRCWGLVPRQGVHYVPDDGTLCECDLVGDITQVNEPNPILVRFRKWIEGEDVADPYWALYWLSAFDEYDAFGGFKTWDDPGHPLHSVITATDAQRSHAQAVLARLADLANLI